MDETLHPFHSLFLIVNIMLNYYYLLEKYKRIEASGPFIPIAGAVLATLVAIYGIQMGFGNEVDGASETKKYRVIPTPSGSVIYFGK